MQLLILFLPLLLFVSISSSRKFISQDNIIRLTLLANTCALVLVVFSFIKFVFNGEIVSLSLGSWNYFGGLYIKYNFLFDALTYVMLLIVVIISFSVQIYSTGYMEKDPQFTNFMAYLALFTFSMLLFVTAGNFVIMFFGWEAVGLCSYLLINFWHTRLNAGKSALKAVIVNKIGDVALLFALAIIYYLYRSFEFSVVFVITSEMTIYKNMLTLMLIIGASAKSAQILLHTWLPDAMEGPTPVSALIHAATMVTAGIFLLIRCSPILEQSNFGLLVCVILGSITAFTAALIGVFQNDIKRIIAYSTCSQLGYLMFVCGLSGYNFAMFHLFNHAFFKALLFLSAGAIIHGINDEQDIRRMGGFVKFLPLSYKAMFIGSISLMGLPFMSGFYSKEPILEYAYSTFGFTGLFAFILGLFSVIFTAFYSIKLIYLIFLSKPNGYKLNIFQAHYTSNAMCIVLGILAIFSIFSGNIFSDIFIGLGTSFWGSSIVIDQAHNNQAIFEFIPTIYKILPLLGTLVGIYAAYFVILGTKL